MSDNARGGYDAVKNSKMNLNDAANIAATVQRVDPGAIRI